MEWDYRYEYRDTYPVTDFGVREVRSCRRTDVMVPPDAEAFVWPDYVVLDSWAKKDHGENVARYTKAINRGGDIWAECIEVEDTAYGTLRGGEMTVAANGGDPNNWRMCWHLMARDAALAYGRPAEPACEVGTCLRINGEPTAWFGSVISARDFSWAFAQVTGGYGGMPSHHIFKFGGSFITGFSFADASFLGSPIRLGRGQTIALEGTDSVRVGLVGDRVSILLHGQPVFQVDIGTGDVFIRGEVRKL